MAKGNIRVRFDGDYSDTVLLPSGGAMTRDGVVLAVLYEHTIETHNTPFRTGDIVKLHDGSLFLNGIIVSSTQVSKIKLEPPFDRITLLLGGIDPDSPRYKWSAYDENDTFLLTLERDGLAQVINHPDRENTITMKFDDDPDGERTVVLDTATTLDLKWVDRWEEAVRLRHGGLQTSKLP